MHARKPQKGEDKYKSLTEPRLYIGYACLPVCMTFASFFLPTKWPGTWWWCGPVSIEPLSRSVVQPTRTIISFSLHASCPDDGARAREPWRPSAWLHATQGRRRPAAPLGPWLEGLRSSSRAAISPDIDDVGSQRSFCLAHLCHRASLETAVVNPVRRCTTTRGFVPIYVPWLHQAVNRSSRSLGSNRYTDAAALQVPTKPRYEKLVDNNKYYI